MGALSGARRIVVKIGSALLVEGGDLRRGWLAGIAADLAEHAHGGLTDRFIVDVAVIRAVELDREAVAVARFAHQRLGPGKVGFGRGVHVLVPAVHEGRGDHAGRR